MLKGKSICKSAAGLIVGATASLLFAYPPIAGAAVAECDDCRFHRVNLYGPLGQVRKESRDPKWRRVERSGGRLHAAESGSAVLMDLSSWQLPGYAARHFDVLKSAGHLFFDADCRLIDKARFWPKDSPVPIDARLVAIGLKECPFSTSNRYMKRMKNGKKRILVPTDDDWAILVTEKKLDPFRHPGITPLPIDPEHLRTIIQGAKRQGTSVDVRVVAHTRQHGTVDSSHNRGTVHPYPGRYYGAIDEAMIAHNAAMELGNSGGSLVLRLGNRFFDVGTQSMRWSRGSPSAPFALFKNPNFAVANHAGVYTALRQAVSHRLTAGAGPLPRTDRIRRVQQATKSRI